MEETQVLNTEQVPTGGNDPKVAAERVKQLHDALVADEVMKDYVPNDFRRFVEVYKDPKNMNSLYDALSADDVFKDYIPDSKERMYDLYVLGKQKSEPAKEPLQSSVSPSPSNGGVEFGLNQTISAPQAPIVEEQPQPASLEFGLAQTVGQEQIPQQQINPVEEPIAGLEEIRFAPEKEIEYKTPESQLDEAIKKTSAEMQKSALRSKGSIGGAIFNSLAEGFTGTVNAASRMTMDLMIYMMPDLVSPDSTPDDINKSFEKMGIKETLDKQIKSEGTTKEYIEKQKEEGGILTQGALGLAESIYPMLYPKQAGFFFLGFNGAAREIEKTMPELSKDKQLLYSFTQGSVALVLENIGLSNLVKNTSVTKAITGKVLEKLKGFTGVLTPSKVQQTVLDVANGFASEFETGATQFVVEEGIKQATDYLGGEKDNFKFEGWESFLTNTLKAGATEGVGGAIMKSASLAPSIMLNPKNKSEAQEANAKNKTLMQDLQNPNITDDVKEVIQKQADENSKVVLEKAFEDKEQVDSLPTEAKTEVEKLNKTINDNNAVLQNENVSAETKELVAKANEDLAAQIEKIFKDNPPTQANTKAAQAPQTTEQATKQEPVTEQNTKVGDVVTDADGNKFTVIGFGKSRGGNDIVEVETAKQTDEQILEIAQTTIWNRNRDFYPNGITDEFLKDFDRTIKQEFNDLVSSRDNSKSSMTLQLNEVFTNQPQTTENAIQEPSATQEIPRTREAGQNILEGGQGVRPSEQGQETTQQGEEEVNDALKDVESTTKALDGLVSKDDELALATITLPKSGKINYKDIKIIDGLPTETWFNKPDKLDKGLRSSYKIYEKLKSGENVPYKTLLLNEKGELLDGYNRLKAMLALGITDFDYAIAPKDFIKGNGKQQISEAYHAAKKDGSNPELVNAVEELLTTKTKQNEKGANKERLLEKLQATGDEGKGGQASAELRTESQAQEKEIADLRAKEQAELDAKIPNAEQYRVNGKVDRALLTTDADRKVFDEVYEAYNKPITDLIRKQKAELKQTEVEELAEPIVIFKGNTGKLNPDGSRRTAHPNIQGVFGSTDLKGAERYGNDISKFDIPKGTTVETVEIKNKKIPLSEARKQETELVNASDAQIVRLITYDAKGKEVQYIIKDKSILQQNKPIKNAEENLTPNIPTNETKNENGKQKDGEKRNENVSENVQGNGKEGGQNVNLQNEEEVTQPRLSDFGLTYKNVNDKFNEVSKIMPYRALETALENLGVERGDLDSAKEAFLAEFISKDLPSKLPNKKDKFDKDDLPKGEVVVKPIIKKITPSNPSNTKTKIDSLKNIVGNDDMRPVMNGVFQDAENGMLAATDAFKLITVSDATITESKIVDPKTGQTIQGRFPNYLAIIPQNNPIQVDVNVQDLINQTAGISRASDFFVGKNEFAIAVRIKIGDNNFYFNPKLLNDVLTVFANYGAKDVTFKLSTPTRAMVIEYGGVTGLLMPVMGENNQGNVLPHVTVVNRELTNKEKADGIKTDLEYLAKKLEDKKKKLSDAKNNVRNASSNKDLNSANFDVKYEEKAVAEAQLEYDNKKAELDNLDNPLQEQFDLETVKTAIENGEITEQEATEFIESTIENTTEVESVIATIESKAESENEVELNEVIQNADKLISSQEGAQVGTDAFADLAKKSGAAKVFSLGGKNIFYHASPKKRKGRLEKNNAPQFGTGIYFSTNKDLVVEEFGDNVTEVELSITNPVYTKGEKWRKVKEEAIKEADKEYGEKNGLTLDEGETYFRYNPDILSEIDEIPSYHISDAAIKLGYDAIIDEGSSMYENEVIVLDENKIIYEEDKTDTFADLANQFGEAAKEAVKPETPTAQTFADISQNGKAGRDARESARKKFGKDAVAKMEEISRNFDKLIEQLESENKVRKECP